MDAAVVERQGEAQAGEPRRSSVRRRASTTWYASAPSGKKGDEEVDKTRTLLVPLQYVSIGGAERHARDGDRISISSDFEGSLDEGQVRIEDKRLEIYGSDQADMPTMTCDWGTLMKLGDKSSVTVSDLVITASGDYGSGIWAQRGADLVVRRCTFTACSLNGVGVHGAATRALFEVCLVKKRNRIAVGTHRLQI